MPSNHCSNWEYHEWLKEKNKGKKAELEPCVLCGANTYWPKAMDVKHRSHYLEEGSGQYCFKCWNKIDHLAILRLEVEVNAHL